MKSKASFEAPDSELLLLILFVGQVQRLLCYEIHI